MSEDYVQNEIRRVLPDFGIHVNMTRNETNDVTSIEIRELYTAPWGFPEFQMEALNKLEYLVDLPLVSQVEVTKIHWPTYKSAEYRGITLDAYYKIDRTKFSGTCDEFLNTLQPMFGEPFLCRRVGEEQSSQSTAISVVKLELLCETPEPVELKDCCQSLDFATKLKRWDGQCVYPVQFRPRKPFYEPAIVQNGGYRFVIYLNRWSPQEANISEICSAIKERTGIRMSLCETEDDDFPKRIFVVTVPLNENLLNVMAQMMERLNTKTEDACTANVALLMLSKAIPE